MCLFNDNWMWSGDMHNGNAYRGLLRLLLRMMVVFQTRFGIHCSFRSVIVRRLHFLLGTAVLMALWPMSCILCWSCDNFAISLRQLTSRFVRVTFIPARFEKLGLCHEASLTDGVVKPIVYWIKYHEQHCNIFATYLLLVSISTLHSSSHQRNVVESL